MPGPGQLVVLAAFVFSPLTPASDCTCGARCVVGCSLPASQAWVSSYPVFSAVKD